VDADAACHAARLTGLSMLADLREALGTLDRSMAELPWSIPVEIEAEMLIRPA
jgi:hypothetical protein